MLALTMAASCAALVLSGCADDDPLFFSLVYDPCFSVDQCVPEAQFCEELTIGFAGELFTDGICSLECAFLGARSPDCPRALVGRNGSCYPSNAAGGRDATPICFEPCNDTNDCAFGFRCLGDLDLCAEGQTCEIDPGDAICVPGPD